MIQALRDRQITWGATFANPDSLTPPLSFGNDPTALQAAHTGVALYDASHWGRIQVSDSDRLRYLHNQSTNDFQRLQPGESCDTVFVTSTARTIDLATAYVLEDAVLLLASPDRRTQLFTWLDRYIFPADRVALTDVTESTIAFHLIGPASATLLTDLGLVNLPANGHQLLSFNGLEVRVAMGSGLALPGYTLIAGVESAAVLWQQLTEAGAVPLGDRPWEQLRITQGRPLPGQELTEDYNPLEAGLWHTISFNKGCYIGQETIARLDTYKGVKQQLWGIHLSEYMEPGTPITFSGDKIGVLTSCTPTAEGIFGLGYVRTKAGGAGMEVQVGNSIGKLNDVPFLTRERMM